MVAYDLYRIMISDLEPWDEIVELNGEPTYFLFLKREYREYYGVTQEVIIKTLSLMQEYEYHQDRGISACLRDNKVQLYGVQAKDTCIVKRYVGKHPLLEQHARSAKKA